MADEVKTEPRMQVERRRRKNPLARVVTVLGVIGWIALAFIILLLDKASPGKEDFFTRFFSAPVQSSWNTGLLRAAVVVLIAVIVICIVGLILNAMRSRRKSDRLNPSIITLGLVSVAAIVIVLVRYGSHLR